MKTQLIALVLILTMLISACSQPQPPAATDTTAEETAPEASEPEEPVTETKGDEKGVSAGGEAASVVINNFKFVPAELKVKKGTTVTWRNEDTAAHTVESSTADNKVLKSDQLDPDDNFTFTFDETGEFPYLCGLHRSMRAKVIVE
jgi:plastocyanin